jgi:hypothetical protein
MCGTTFPLTQWLLRPFDAAYSCGAVADFHRLPEHPIAQIHNLARTRRRGTIPAAPSRLLRTKPPYPAPYSASVRKSRYKSSPSASQSEGAALVTDGYEGSSGKSPFVPCPANRARRDPAPEITESISCQGLYTRCTKPSVCMQFLPKVPWILVSRTTGSGPGC